MYTVKELIEALKQCPEDYEVEISTPHTMPLSIDCVGIDHDTCTVDLFGE